MEKLGIMLRVMVMIIFFINIWIMTINYEHWTQNDTKAPHEATNERHTNKDRRQKIHSYSQHVNHKQDQERRADEDQESVPLTPASSLRSISITAISSRNRMFVSVDGLPVHEDMKSRGIHLVVINQYNGNVMGRKV